MIKVEGKTLRALQKTELEMLVEVDRICRTHDIPYVIIAGTMLGAVRHGGFIPWDDDADIAMLRGDYERFRNICETELDTSRFSFQDHVVTKGYRWGYGKLRRKDSAFVREHQEQMPYDQGIFIDIFPMDYVPESHLFRTLMNFECFCIRKFLWARVGKTADQNRFKRLVYAGMDRVPEEKILGVYDRLIDRTRRKKTGWVRILMFPTPNREYGYRTVWYENRKEIVFEGTRLMGIEDADGYLRFKFNDYMQMPPAEMRKTHPVSAIRIPEWAMKEVEHDSENT